MATIEDAVKNKVQGKVYVILYLDSTGTPCDYEIAKGIGYGCDEEAVRVLMSAKFTPAKIRGKNIPISIAVPVHFKFK